jgi:hypothetical protein
MGAPARWRSRLEETVPLPQEPATAEVDPETSSTRTHRVIAVRSRRIGNRLALT